MDVAQNRSARVPASSEVTDTRDEVLDAIDLLVEALRANTARNKQAIRRAAAIRKMREKGLPYREIVAVEGKPLLVEITRENLAALAEHGSAVRRAKAKALHAEGMTMDEIAEVFGVTRQRVSALLKEAGDRPDGQSRSSTG